MMEAICNEDDGGCGLRILIVALHSLNIYCATLASVLVNCCASKSRQCKYIPWRAQNVRGVATLSLGAVWGCAGAAGLMRASRWLEVASALTPAASWLAAAALHLTLWSRRAAAPLLYLAIYWLLASVCSTAALIQNLRAPLRFQAVDIYFQALSLLLCAVVAVVDFICFFDEVTKSYFCNQVVITATDKKVTYKHEHVHFFSKVTFFWLNSLLYKGYGTPLDDEDLGELPQNESSDLHYEKFRKIYVGKTVKERQRQTTSLWRCYMRMVWPNFYIAGLFKLFSDMAAVVPPLGLSVVIGFTEKPTKATDAIEPVTFYEYVNNGHVMLFLLTLALVAQALLSQNSTHMVTTEGIRLKTALQAMIYDKCMKLAPWASSIIDTDEESPLMPCSGKSEQAHTGLITNLVSQDTYNIMSSVWICHYIWAIPLKVSVILYFLYTKLGISSIIGSVVSILIITPLQLYIGKKISANSKHISKCTDHRMSKMSEILRGLNVIKLYVWEDLFKEKILNLREVELKLLNKDSIYWNFLTFSTQVSTILLTVITFTVYYFLENTEGLTAVNVFAGLALFNQLTVPLLILPVTVLMIIQAVVSTKRIRNFLDLPESNNTIDDPSNLKRNSNVFNEAFVHNIPEDNGSLSESDKEDFKNTIEREVDAYTEEEQEQQRYLVKFQNTLFSWGMKNESPTLEVDDLEIPTGKLIMIVGSTGSGKSSLLSAVLGEMYLERGDVFWNGPRSTTYAGQPPWLMEGSVRDNIVMDGSWCPKKYAQVLRATGLRPDLQLLPEGDATVLGRNGTPLSGGQRVRVGVARALYSQARLLALDEPLAALDATLARHVVARAFVPAAREGRTLLLATNRLELMHYADLVIVMEDGRVGGFGRWGSGGALSQWVQLAAEARAAAARCKADGGAARERSRLVRALSRAKFQRTVSDDVAVGVCEMSGAHLLTEVAMCGGGSWRSASMRQRPALSRQLSSPPPTSKYRRDVRRVMSADASNATLRREASLMRRFLKPRPHRTLSRWTPRPLRRLLSSDSETNADDNQSNGKGEESTLETTYTSISTNGVETLPMQHAEVPLDNEQLKSDCNECSVWLEFGKACGWWGAGYWACAICAQALAVAADCWLAYLTTENSKKSLSSDKMWECISIYGFWCIGGALMAGLAQVACGCAGAAARRVLHERLLHASLHAPLYYHYSTPIGAALHRFSADVQVIDKKLPTAVSRWAQLALLCLASVLVNVAAAPWSLLALIPTLALYLMLQSVYLRNARELQHVEAYTTAPIVSLASEAGSGGSTIRAGKLQTYLRNKYLQRLDDNHNALLLLNAANRWLGLALDLVGASAVCVSMGLGSSSGAALAGLAGAHSLLLPAYLAHLAKCRADLDLHLSAVQRVRRDTIVPQEDYREDCPIPTDWQRNGKIEFKNVNIQHAPGIPSTVFNVNLSISPGEKVAVCGRSGSGKSTLLLSCVGATRVCSGSITVDEVEASRIPLRALRHRLVVLPQEPVLFSGTLRENLDPLGVHTDHEIWESLRLVGLYDFVAAQPAGLECSVGAEGGRWSGGRAARTCAARAAIRAPLASALLLDEPAAALHAPADRALLLALHRAAPNCTVVTVAHRISSVRNYDRAIVVDRGSVVEQGSPAALLAQPSSRLARMNAATQDT